jgi:hypothetical protein
MFGLGMVNTVSSGDCGGGDGGGGDGDGDGDGDDDDGGLDGAA